MIFYFDIGHTAISVCLILWKVKRLRWWFTINDRNWRSWGRHVADMFYMSAS